MAERRRTRMISFRVSASEFEMLKVKTEQEGATNLSEFARLSLCRREHGRDILKVGIDQLNDEVQQLRADLVRLTEALEGSRRLAERPRIALASRKGAGA